MKEVLTAILLLNQVKVKLQSPILDLIMNHQTKISKLNEKAEAKKRLDRVVGVELEEVQDLRGKKGLLKIKLNLLMIARIFHNFQIYLMNFSSFELLKIFSFISPITAVGTSL